MWKTGKEQITGSTRPIPGLDSFELLSVMWSSPADGFGPVAAGSQPVLTNQHPGRRPSASSRFCAPHWGRLPRFDQREQRGPSRMNPASNTAQPERATNRTVWITLSHRARGASSQLAASRLISTPRDASASAVVTQPRSVDLGGRAHSSLSHYRFVARQIRGVSFVHPRRRLTQPLC